MAIVPDEDQTVLVEDRDDNGKVMEGESEMICFKSRFGDYLVLIELDFSEVHEFSRTKSLPGLGFPLKFSSQLHEGRYHETVLAITTWDFPSFDASTNPAFSNMLTVPDHIILAPC